MRPQREANSRFIPFPCTSSTLSYVPAPMLTQGPHRQRTSGLLRGPRGRRRGAALGAGTDDADHRAVLQRVRTLDDDLGAGFDAADLYTISGLQSRLDRHRLGLAVDDHVDGLAGLG